MLESDGSQIFGSVGIFVGTVFPQIRLYNIETVWFGKTKDNIIFLWYGLLTLKSQNDIFQILLYIGFLTMTLIFFVS